MTNSKFNIPLLFTCQALSMTINGIVMITSALIGYSLVENKSLATLPLGLSFVSCTCMIYFASFIMKKYGRQKGFILGALIGAFAGFVSTFALYTQSFIVFIIGLCLTGASVSFALFYRYAAVEIVPPEKKNKAIAYVVSGGIVSAILSAPLTTASKDMFEPILYMGCYSLFIIINLLVAFCLVYIKFPEAKKIKDIEKPQDIRPMSEIIKQPVFIVSLSSTMLSYGMMVMVMTATPLAMQNCLISFNKTASVIQWHALGMYVPSLFSGHFIDRFGRLKVIIAGMVCYLACAFINFSGQTFWHFWSALLLLGIGWNFMFVGGTSLLTTSYTEAEKSKVQGFNDTLMYSTVAAFSLFSGWIQSKYGWITVNAGVIPSILLAAALLYTCRQLSKRNERNNSLKQ